MSHTTKLARAAMMLATLGAATAGRADDAPAKQWVWLKDQGVWGYGYQLQEGPNRGRWKIDPGTKVAPEDLAPTTDAYGFAAVLNAHRASAGLPPLAYDPELSQWAAANNQAQAARGLGHHVSPNCYQNCAYNSTSADDAAANWMNSRDHRANMLAPTATTFGVAYGPGPYWTLNLR
jgi:hypothetical protein